MTIELQLKYLCFFTNCLKNINENKTAGRTPSANLQYLKLEKFPMIVIIFWGFLYFIIDLAHLFYQFPIVVAQFIKFNQKDT